MDNRKLQQVFYRIYEVATQHLERGTYEKDDAEKMARELAEIAALASSAMDRLHADS